MVVWRDLAERQRQVLVGSQLLKVDGRWEREGEVRHLIARRLSDLSPLLEGINVRSRDFH
ncbi:error-prone DNA polymerase [compost metagenome]